MHGFRDRPLTWLFIGATISVDLVMILPMLFPSAMLDDYFPKLIITIGVPMQLSLVAIWAATSDRYRLMRGAVLVIWGVTLAMRLLGWLPGWNSRCTSECAAVPSLWEPPPFLREPPMSAMESQDEDKTIEKLRPWQFSVVELFGWSCIVALWAYALHHAILRPHPWGWWLARATMVPLLMVGLLGGPGSWRLRCGCVGLVIGLMLFMQRAYGVAVLSAFYLIPVVYLALWYAVRRLDGKMDR